MSKIRILLLLFITLSLNIFLITGCSKEESNANVIHNDTNDETLVASFAYENGTDSLGKMYLDENGDVCCIYSIPNDYASQSNYSSDIGYFGFKYNIYNVDKGTLSDFVLSEKVIDQVPELNDPYAYAYIGVLTVNKDNSKNISFNGRRTDENETILDNYTIMKVDVDGKFLYKISLPEIDGTEDLYSTNTFNTHNTYYLENENLCIFSESFSNDFENPEKFTRVSIINPYTKKLVSTVNLNVDPFSKFATFVENYIYFKSSFTNIISVFDIYTGEKINEFTSDGFIQASDGSLYSLNENGIYRLSLDGSDSECILKSSDSQYFFQSQGSEAYKNSYFSDSNTFLVSENRLYFSYINHFNSEINSPTKDFVKYVLK